jgi:hypothetical protein
MAADAASIFPFDESALQSVVQSGSGTRFGIVVSTRKAAVFPTDAAARQSLLQAGATEPT